MKTSNRILFITGIVIAGIVLASIIGSRILLSRHMDSYSEIQQHIKVADIRCLYR